MLMEPMGASMDYASTPTPLTEFDDQMTFMQRIINVVQSELMQFFMDWFIMRPLADRIRIDFPQTKSLVELRREASLVIVNSHSATGIYIHIILTQPFKTQ